MYIYIKYYSLVTYFMQTHSRHTCLDRKGLFFFIFSILKGPLMHWIPTKAKKNKKNSLTTHKCIKMTAFSPSKKNPETRKSNNLEGWGVHLNRCHHVDVISFLLFWKFKYIFLFHVTPQFTNHRLRLSYSPPLLLKVKLNLYCSI